MFDSIAYARAYRKANPEKIKAAHAKYRAAHPGQGSAYNKKWREAHPEKLAEYAAKAREVRPTHKKLIQDAIAHLDASRVAEAKACLLACLPAATSA